MRDNYISDSYYSELSFSLGKKFGHDKGIEDAIHDTIYKNNKSQYSINYPEFKTKQNLIDYEDYDQGYACGYYGIYYNVYGLHKHVIDELILKHNKSNIVFNILYKYRSNQIFENQLIFEILNYVDNSSKILNTANTS